MDTDDFMIMLGACGLTLSLPANEAVLAFSDQQLLCNAALGDSVLADTRVRSFSITVNDMNRVRHHADVHQVSGDLRQDSLVSSNTVTDTTTLEVDPAWADLMADELFVQALQATNTVVPLDTDQDWQPTTSNHSSEESARISTVDDAPNSYLPLHNVPPPPPMSPPPPGDRTRAQAIARYLEKKARRVHTKKIRYQMRKLNADRRPRVKGRFVKREEAAAMLAEGHV